MIVVILDVTLVILMQIIVNRVIQDIYSITPDNLVTQLVLLNRTLIILLKPVNYVMQHVNLVLVQLLPNVHRAMMLYQFYTKILVYNVQIL